MLVVQSEADLFLSKRIQINTNISCFADPMRSPFTHACNVIEASNFLEQAVTSSDTTYSRKLDKPPCCVDYPQKYQKNSDKWSALPWKKNKGTAKAEQLTSMPYLSMHAIYVPVNIRPETNLVYSEQ